MEAPAAGEARPCAAPSKIHIPNLGKVASLKTLAAAAGRRPPSRWRANAYSGILDARDERCDSSWS
jgi:hypothetical protein